LDVLIVGSSLTCSSGDTRRIFFFLSLQRVIYRKRVDEVKESEVGKNGHVLLQEKR